MTERGTSSVEEQSKHDLTVEQEARDDWNDSVATEREEGSGAAIETTNGANGVIEPEKGLDSAEEKDTDGKLTNGTPNTVDSKASVVTNYSDTAINQLKITLEVGSEY